VRTCTGLGAGASGLSAGPQALTASETARSRDELKPNDEVMSRLREW
jgi:hypothetical protein